MTNRQHFFSFIRIFLSIGYYLLVACPLVVSAAQVTLQWETSGPLPDGYNLYQRSSGQAYDYSNPINQTVISGTSFTVENLQAGQTYYFVVRSFAGSVASPDSNEVQYMTPAAITDSDHDGYADPIDAFPEDQYEWVDTDHDGTGDNADLDDDADGMPDAWESIYGLNALVDDANGDLDGDGISNIDEYNSGSDPSQVPGNISPDQPILVQPANGAIGVDLMPTLMTEAFVDADQDKHARTRFQVSLEPNWDAGDGTGYIFDGVFAEQLTSLPLGDMLLDPETTYYWRVKYYDDRNGESAWSATWHFTTTDNRSAGYLDEDGDGILNDQEVADENVDPDLGATSGMLVVGSNDSINPQLALAHSSSADVLAVRTLDLSAVELGSSANRPGIMTGLLSFKLRLLGNETTASISVYLTEPAPADANWYKYDIEQGWVAYPNVTFSDDRKTVTIYLVDGGEGDDDGVRNGIIVDPSGLGYRASSSLGYSSQTTNSSSDSDSITGGCFITAAMDNLSSDRSTRGWMFLFGLFAAALVSAVVKK